MGYVLLALVALLFLSFPVVVAHLLGRLAGFATRRLTSSSEKSTFYGRLASRCTHIGVGLFVAYQGYFALHPADDFFLGEFREVTQRAAPVDTKILAKYASYPDLHGDYCSFSRMEMSASSYEHLIVDLSSDKQMTERAAGHISTGWLSQPVDPQRVSRSFTRNDDHLDHHFFIDFLDSGRHVEVRVCVT